MFRLVLVSESVPSATVMSRAAAPTKGASRPVSASAMALSRAACAASSTAAVALAAVADPIAGCDSGNRVSAEPHDHLVSRQTERIGGDLRHRGVSAGADVVCGG